MRGKMNGKIFAGFVLMLVTAFSLAPVGASSANISHSYHTTAPMADGSIVSLDTDKSDYVIPANAANGDRLVGVTVKRDDSLLAVDPDAGSVQVATSGTVNTLVSTVNGPIRVGDEVAASPFNGVGMKAAPGTRIIGLAQSVLDKNTEGVTAQKVTDKNGASQQIYVGYVRLSISVGVDTAKAAGGNNLNVLQKLAKSLTGHTVSMVRIVISLAIAVVALAALVTLMYASIYGSIISVGRNPLAKYAIFRTLGSVLVMAFLIAGVSGVSIFFLLR